MLAVLIDVTYQLDQDQMDAGFGKRMPRRQSSKFLRSAKASDYGSSPKQPERKQSAKVNYSNNQQSASTDYSNNQQYTTTDYSNDQQPAGADYSNGQQSASNSYSDDEQSTGYGDQQPASDAGYSKQQSGASAGYSEQGQQKSVSDMVASFIHWQFDGIIECIAEWNAIQLRLGSQR